MWAGPCPNCVESGVCHAEIVLSRLTSSFFSREYLIQIHQSWFPQPCTYTYSLGPVYLVLSPNAYRFYITVTMS